MRTAKLYAHRDGEKLCVAEGITRDEARDLIEDMDMHVGVQPGQYETVAEQIEAGIWPEGYEAHYVTRGGRWYMFTDKWEPINAWKAE